MLSAFTVWMCAHEEAAMRAELRYLHSPDADPLKDFRPKGPFGILVTAIIGPHADKGQEAFNFMLCTPEWFVSDRLPMTNSIAVGRHVVFLREFDYPALEAFVRDYCVSCEGDTWHEVASKVARFGHWEFEDYRPFKPT